MNVSLLVMFWQQRKRFFVEICCIFFIDVVIIKHDVNLLSLNRRFAAFEDMDNTYLDV